MPLRSTDQRAVAVGPVPPDHTVGCFPLDATHGSVRRCGTPFGAPGDHPDLSRNLVAETTVELRGRVAPVDMTRFDRTITCVASPICLPPASENPAGAIAHS